MIAEPLTTTTDVLKAPFPYFGGKSRIASLVWSRFGKVQNYVEPFFGSGAVLLANPYWPHGWTETVNDADGLLSNFWRALQHAPDEVAYWADWPVNENDLHARHYWLVQRRESLQERLEGDPDFYDAKAAGWWVWGLCIWIGSRWCAGDGPWRVVDGRLVKTGDAETGVRRNKPRLSSAGVSINRQLPHLSSAGVSINRKLPRATCTERTEWLLDYFGRLADRMRAVRVCCGDWSRVCTPAVTTTHGLTAVFLDPPYSAAAGRDSDIYTIEDLVVAERVREWCVANGDNPQLRIALCGYDGEHEMPAGWECVAWKAQGGYGNQGNGNGKANRHRERVWFSPHCLKPGQATLFDGVDDDEVE